LKISVTGAVIVDLAVAYDTINHNVLPNQRLGICTNSNLSVTKFPFFGDKTNGADGEDNIMGLSQASVLAPILFNMYTNDQPIIKNTKLFLHADDLAITRDAKKRNNIKWFGNTLPYTDYPV